MFSETASTLSKFVELVETFWVRGVSAGREVPDWIWYRGVSSYPKYRLVPSFYRNVLPTPTPAEIDAKEKLLVREFKYKYDLYDTNHVGRMAPLEPAVVFGKMQHYGLSTRLLDFSYSALVALWMAVGDWRQWADGKEIADPVNNGAVWLLDPCKANGKLGHDETISNLELEERYLPIGLRERGTVPDEPIAVEAALANQRIVAQQGCFICFGTNPSPLEEQLGPAFDEIGIIVVPAVDKPRIYDQLERVGITEDFLFQDLQTYSVRLLRQYGARGRKAST